MKRYEQVAEDIANSISRGMLRKGDRLPSVRQASQRRGVSPSTIFQAYYLLEARGLISARERSGYYVTGGVGAMPQLPDLPAPTHAALTTVDVSELVFEVLASVRTGKLLPLGSAFPSPLLFPLGKLARIMASTVQAMDPWATVRDLSPGDEQLRRQIALRYQIDGLQVPPEEIIITNGALEALNLCLAAIGAKPGDNILIESPAFYAALQAIERNGLQAVEVPTHPSRGADLDAMEHAIRQHRPKACWLMTNFQNPTGSLMPEENKRALVALLGRYEIPLIEDDVYAELYFGEKRPLPAKTFDHEGLVLHCSSFSKCLAPGYRVGWVAPGRYARSVERIKLTTTLAASVPAQQTLANYLARGHYDRHLRTLRHTLLLQQIRFVQAVEQYFPHGTRLTAPAGGYFVWIKLPDGVDALMLHRRAVAAGISIAPGPMFSARRGFENYVRLNYGHLWDADLDTGLARLGRLVAELAGERR